MDIARRAIDAVTFAREMSSAANARTSSVSGAQKRFSLSGDLKSSKMAVRFASFTAVVRTTEVSDGVFTLAGACSTRLFFVRHNKVQSYVPLL